MDDIASTIYNFSYDRDYLNILLELNNKTNSQLNLKLDNFINMIDNNLVKIFEYYINTDLIDYITSDIINYAIKNKKIEVLKILLSSKKIINNISLDSFLTTSLPIDIIKLKDLELYKILLNILKDINVIHHIIDYIYKHNYPEEYIKLLLLHNNNTLDDIETIKFISRLEKINKKGTSNEVYKYINSIQSLLLSDKFKNFDEVYHYNYNNLDTMTLFQKVLDNIIEIKNEEMLNTYVQKYPLILSIYFIEKYIDPKYNYYIHVMLNKLLELYEDKFNYIEKFTPDRIKQIYYTLAILISGIDDKDFQTKVVMLEYLNKAGDYENSEILFSRFFNDFAGLPSNIDTKFNIESILKLIMNIKK